MPQSRCFGLTYSVLALSVGVGLVSCHRASPPPEPPDVRPWVAGEAAHSVDEAGHFQLPPPAPHGSTPMLSPEEAIRITTAWVHHREGYREMPKDFHGERLSDMEKEHGDIIEFQSLQAGPVYYPQIPYEPLPDTLPEHVRRAYGPHYVVPFYSRRGLQVMLTSVFAEDTALWVDEQGRVRKGQTGGGLPFSQHAISAGAEYPVPLTPECAVRLVAEATGRKVVRRPELVHPGGRWAPTVVYWKLMLDQPLMVRGDSTQQFESLRVLYVDVEPKRGIQPAPLQLIWRRALPEQPRTDTIAHLDRISRRQKPPRVRTTELKIRPGYAIRFETVTPLEGSIQPAERHFPCQAPLNSVGSRAAMRPPA